MNKIIVVRHGEAEHILTGTVGGWTDTELTAYGMRQALLTGRRLAQTLEDAEVAFYCSDLQRALHTAELIGKAADRTPLACKDLRDLNNGLAANKTAAEAEELLLPQTEPILDWIRYPDGESWMMMHERISRFMERIDQSAQSSVIVTHANPAVAIIQWWLELPQEVMARVFFDIALCSVTVLTINSWHEKTIAKLNDTCHLAGQSLLG